jgi:uncharacterized protein
MRNPDILRLRETKYVDASIETIHLDGSFSGYASIFGEIDLGNDIVESGAFAKALENRGASGIRMLFQHNPDFPIGCWQTIREDSKGLHVSGKIATATPKGSEVLEMMRARAIDGLSIGFRTIRASKENKRGVRRIIEADLWEISVVTFPMQPQARINALKSMHSTNNLPTIREFERWLMHDAGLTRRDARMVITKGYTQLAGMRDAAATNPDNLAARFRQAAMQIQPSAKHRS